MSEHDIVLEEATQEPVALEVSEAVIEAVSPKVSTEAIEGGHRVTVTDIDGEKTFDVMDGERGQDGVSPSVNVEDVTGGHRVTVTDADGQHAFDVMDGGKGDPGDPGDPGQDGVSPSISVTEITGGHRVTVTDADGGQAFDVLDGEPGKPGDPGDPGRDGVSPTITVTDITGGHRVTITDATGMHSFDVLDGADGASSVADVQVNGVSVVQDGVANVPLASTQSLGVIKIGAGGGLFVNSNTGAMYTSAPTASQVKGGTEIYRPITPSAQHAAAFYGLAKAAGDTTQSQSSNAVGAYTESAKSAISEMLGGAVEISGTTPSITGMAGVRYVCGECATLDVIAPATGCIDVIFTSGSTPTALTVTSAKANTTIKWANGFAPSSLDADTVYEINILDGELGVAGAWT